MSRRNNIIKTTLTLIIYIICTLTISAQNAGYFTHTVSKGQTLYSISRMYEVTVDEIISLNPDCAQKIAIGQKLKIAQKNSAAQPDKLYHTIKSGETLYRLSNIYGVTPEAICNANPGLSIKNFRTGEVILIPTKGIAKTQPAPAPVQKEEKEENTQIRTTHKVEKGETLYSISRSYNITVDELLAANPQIKNKKLKLN